MRYRCGIVKRMNHIKSLKLISQYFNLHLLFWALRCIWAPVAWAAVRSGAMVLLLLTFCLLLLPLWGSVVVLFFVVRYFMSILVLQSIREKRAGCFAFVFLVSRDG